MKKWLPVVALLCLLTGIGLFLDLKPSRPADNSAETNSSAIAKNNSSLPVAPTVVPQNSPPSPAASINPATTSSNGPNSDATASTKPVPSEPVASTPESASLPPATILDNMRVTIRAYGLMFGGNPVGTNPEITKQLSGDNPKQVNFLKADGNRVNSNGELVDAWGTPYFFHQLSGTVMEIHSAGPDRILWTSDDLVIK